MKNLLSAISPAFLLLLPLLGYGQEYRISGRVVDANTREPIPFASLGLQAAGTGTLTNESGFFQLNGPDKLQRDSLVFMTLGYGRRALLVEQSTAENLQIALSPRPAGFTTICRIAPNAAAGNPGLTANDEVITGLPGSQYAFFIDNDKRKQTRKMRSITFYIGENGLPMAPFRIHIYKIAGNKQLPGTDLLAEQVVLVPSQSGQWFTADLSRYNIIAPREGYFVALEFEKPANQLPQPNLDTYVPAGQIMRPPFDFKKSSLWRYSSEMGWTLVPQSSSSRRYNAMVKVEVEAAE